MKSPTQACSRSLLLAVLTLLTCIPGLCAADDKKSPAKDKRDSSDPIDSIGKMIPEGKKNLKVRIPGFDQGRASSLVVAAAMTRINPQELFAENMRIDLYGKEAKDNIRVDLKTGTYHMDNKMLTSKERSRVTRSDFKIEGDSMEFDTTSSQGKMIGNVQMIIYDTSSFRNAPKTEESQASPQAASPAEAAQPAQSPTTPPGKKP